MKKYGFVGIRTYAKETQISSIFVQKTGFLSKKLK